MEDWNGIAKMIGFVDERAMLQCFYVDEALPITEIAKKLSCGPATVASRLVKNNIKARPRGGANNSHRISKKLFRMDQRLVFQLPDNELAKLVDAHQSTVYKYQRAVCAVKKGWQ